MPGNRFWKLFFGGVAVATWTVLMAATLHHGGLHELTLCLGGAVFGGAAVACAVESVPDHYDFGGQP